MVLSTEPKKGTATKKKRSSARPRGGKSVLELLGLVRKKKTWGKRETGSPRSGKRRPFSRGSTQRPAEKGTLLYQRYAGALMGNQAAFREKKRGRASPRRPLGPQRTTLRQKRKDHPPKYEKMLGGEVPRGKKPLHLPS